MHIPCLERLYTMFSPMLVQYLVGLCCLRYDPDAVDVTIGDMVWDEAAEKDRDVDITVTIVGDDGEISAFKASEVKHEGKPLDVGAVEQLILKLNDMPKVTHKAIFSTSGYTDGARKKATSHGVDLYTLQPWENRIENDFPDFPGVGTPSEFLRQFSGSLLCWPQHKLSITCAPGSPTSFVINDEDRIYDRDGSAHPTHPTFGEYKHAILLRSTEILYMLEPAQTVLHTFPYGLREHDDFSLGPAWPHTHTLDVRADEVYAKIDEGKPFRFDSITISGNLQWQRRNSKLEFNILKRVTDDAVFAGAAVAAYGIDDERMFAMIFPSKGRELSINLFSIPEKQRNMIRKLKIKG
ncbi:hypothetical protein D1006_38235 [Burkholderia stabilis]|uniref:Uncharacterized protein n=2 Tax=Burkholderia stabilis TaxID=95485 RepID=A0A4Q2A9Q6_9BURK|nr:hypothetical protein D1006_38235 [Burkholderia stabilis]